MLAAMWTVQTAHLGFGSIRWCDLCGKELKTCSCHLALRSVSVREVVQVRVYVHLRTDRWVSSTECHVAINNNARRTHAAL